MYIKTSQFYISISIAYIAYIFKIICKILFHGENMHGSNFFCLTDLYVFNIITFIEQKYYSIICGKKFNERKNGLKKVKNYGAGGTDIERAEL